MGQRGGVIGTGPGLQPGREPPERERERKVMFFCFNKCHTEISLIRAFASQAQIQ